MEELLTVFEESSGEVTEKRSRFIAVLHHCETEEEAAAFLSDIRALHRDARHHCYAYSVAGGTVKRFSDDGEPHGTAGKPILEVIEGAGLSDIAVVVTRYFGGVLLGTGGLVRAYTEAAKEAVHRAEVVKMVLCSVFQTVCEYSDAERLIRLIENAGGKVEQTDYATDVTLTYYMENGEEERFLALLKEAFSARLHAEKMKEKRLPMAVGREI